VDVDLVLSGGERRYAAVIDNGPTFEPFFGETWACLPSQLSGEKQRELEAMAIKAVKALGFTDGVYHVELKYTPNGPRLIEVNARMGGGPTRMIHKLVSGIDLVREQFLIALGEPSRPIFSEDPLQFIAYAFINCRATGAVSDISFLDKYRQVPGVVWILPYVRPFERCVGPEDGHPSWLGDIVVAVSENSETALRLVKKLEEEIADEFASRRITHGRCHD
jgi:carnosine synthase